MQMADGSFSASVRACVSVRLCARVRGGNNRPHARQHTKQANNKSNRTHPTRFASQVVAGTNWRITVQVTDGKVRSLASCAPRNSAMKTHAAGDAKSMRGTVRDTLVACETKAVFLGTRRPSDRHSVGAIEEPA
jgi:hypothetical protein